jgi:hypothetical protein
MKVVAQFYKQVVPRRIRSSISSLVGDLSGLDARMKHLENQLVFRDLEISNLRSDLKTNTEQTFAMLSSRDNRIHEFVKSALALAATDLKEVKLVTTESKGCELGKIFDHCGSDKNSRHSYADVYEDLLADKEVPRILEIGLGSLNDFPYAGLKPGCSLQAWRTRYPKALIVGADIDPESVQAVSEIAFLVDQTDPSSLEGLSRNLREYRPFDLVVDDGFHDPHANIQTLIKLLPHLAEDGAYIVEDVHSSLIDFWRIVIAAMGLNGEVLDMSSLRPQTDDNVLVIVRHNLKNSS